MKLLYLSLILILCNSINGYTQENKQSDIYVDGAQFIDRFLPLQNGKLDDKVWGAQNVLPRFIDNGLEDADYSYWGGNIAVGDDGKNHLFVCRWPQDVKNKDGSKSGHNMWWKSDVVHAVSEHPEGPYKVVEEIGKGHNPEIYRLKDGSYILGVAFHGAYKAASLEGPWEQIETTFNFIPKEKIQKGGRDHDNKTNRTYVVRDDGSVLMMNKTGFVFISKNEDEKFVQFTNKTAYPHLPKPAHLEDPVIWKDEVQYNLIVNDCIGRSAIYLRSPDGINWKWEKGVAYNPTIVHHAGGTTEDWWKLERPKVRQDQYGRVTHMNFAAIDTLKNEDRANDKHSSKNIVVPMVVQKRMFLIDKKPINGNTKIISVLVKSEKGFNPHTDINLKSLKFGTAENVNLGKGCKLKKTKKKGKDLILVFDGTNNGFTNENFAGKLLGKTNKGEMLFGYAKLNN